MTAFYRTDRFGNPLGRLGYVYSAQRDRTTNGTDVLDISCKTQCDKGDRIVFIDSAGNPREYIITDLEQNREDSLDFTYHCSNSITELALFFIEERRSRSENAQQMLTRVLEGTRWHVGSVTTGGANNLSFYHVSAYQAILDICELWGLEWETQLTISADGSHINGRSINLVPHVGSTSARRFDFGKNLVGLSRTVDSANVITRLYPYGNSVQETDTSGEATGGYSRKIDISSVNGGKTYIEDTAATLLWGVPDASGQVQPAMGMQEYDADDPATLLAMAQADLPNLTQPKVSYTATVATLGIEGVDRYGIGVGDDVYVNDTAYPTPIRLKGRVLEIVDDLVDPLSDDTQITLGNLVGTYTADMDRVSGIVDMLTSNSGIWNDAANATPSYIDSVIAGLNQQLNQTGGYVYLEPNEGLIVYDRPKDENPTMAIQLGGGYFRIANSKKSDGSWDWRTAGTGAGLVADVLVAGIIAGGSNWWNLETGDLSFTQGTIGRSDGSTYWNLTTGDFRFAPTSSIGDTGNTIGGTIIDTNVQYGLSNNESTVPSSWTDTAEWAKGKVLWSRTMSKSADGTVTYGTPQVIIGVNGNGVSSVREQYYLSQSNTTQTGGSWGYAQPAWVKGRYYWTRSEITWSDGSVSYTTPVLANALTSGNQSTTDLDSALNQQGVFNRLTNNGALEGLYMEDGRLYINASYMKAGIITDNVGRNFWNLNTGEFSLSATTQVGGKPINGTVISVDLEYGLSSSTSSQPTSWNTSAQWEPNHCLWSRQKLTMLDGNIKYTTPSRITDLNGMGAYTVREQYYLSTSSSSQSGGSWSYAQQSWVNGCYYWTRSEITMSDGSKQYTTPVLASGLTSGNQSTTDLDSALNQQGVFNRLTNNGALEGLYMEDGRLYINASYMKAGIITDNVGQNFWNLNTGEFSLSPTNTEIGGVAASDIVVNADVQYGLSTSETTEPTSWGTSAQWSPGHCLWSRQKITLLNNAVVYSEASRITDLNGMGAYQVREQYYLSTSNTTQLDGAWLYSQPLWVKGRYYWTRSEITMSDGSKQYTTPVFASALTSGNQSTDDLDESLNQEEVFSRLTNNGELQGIYMSGGKLYINATYLRTGIITGGSSHWNLNTGEFTTYNMQANNITAKGTFSCGPNSSRTELNSQGQMAGYHDNTRIGYIDYSAASHDVDNPSIINRGIQLQAKGIFRISSPRISVAASSNVGTTANYGWTGTARQKIVSSITDNGNGTIRWHYGTMTISVINGIVTNITTFD